MKAKYSKQLKRLAERLPKLYVVGGSVRNSLLGFLDTDIDVAAEYTPDEVTAALKNSDFSAVTVNRRLGTMRIFDRSDKGFYLEYTTFRSDSYPVGSGAHIPASVEFTRSIETDARRRDFTVNSLYQSVLSGGIVDVTGGLADLKNRVLRTCRAPREVFSEDGLRLMRLVRFSAELGFEIEKDTFAAAKELSYLLDDISVERVRDELLKIVVADTKYPCSPNDAHIKGLRLLDELGLLIKIFPELYDGKGFLQDARYHVYDVFEHNLQTYAAAPPEIRLAALLHDVGKPASQTKLGNMYGHSNEGMRIVSERLGAKGLKFPKTEIDRIIKLIAGHMYDLDGKASEKNCGYLLLQMSA
jgi:tRNA nucleotidyltransferase/poly(A) polymerase